MVAMAESNKRSLFAGVATRVDKMRVHDSGKVEQTKPVRRRCYATHRNSLPRFNLPRRLRAIHVPDGYGHCIHSNVCRKSMPRNS